MAARTKLLSYQVALGIDPTQKPKKTNELSIGERMQLNRTARALQNQQNMQIKDKEENLGETQTKNPWNETNDQQVEEKIEAPSSFQKPKTTKVQKE